MPFETKEQLRAKLNLAEDAFARLQGQAEIVRKELETELARVRPQMTRMVYAAFLGGLLLGACVALAVRY